MAHTNTLVEGEHYEEVKLVRLHAGVSQGWRGRNLSNRRTAVDERLRFIVNNAKMDCNVSPVVEHVKDGKPLTPLGAKLLGVPWVR